MPGTLSDRTITSLMEAGNLKFMPPLDKNQVQPGSVDLRLGNSFKMMKPGPALDTRKKLPPDEELYEVVTLQDGDAFLLPAKTFVLATTKDYMFLPDDVGGMIHGRSSIGRLGTFTENAGWVDPGFEGEITLELYNASPRDLILYVGDRICQIELIQTDVMPKNPYRGKYQGQKGATASLLFKDFMD